MDFFILADFMLRLEADHRGGGLQPLKYQPRGLRLRHLREHNNKAGSKLFRTYRYRGSTRFDLDFFVFGGFHAEV